MEPYEVLGVLNAYDPDAGENGTVNYRLQQPHEYFELKRSGKSTVFRLLKIVLGELRLKKRLAPDSIRRLYHLPIIAEDQGIKPRSVVCQLVIKYEESRSLVKILEPLQRTIRIAPDIIKGTDILHIEAMNAKKWSIDGRNGNNTIFFQLIFRCVSILHH